MILGIEKGCLGFETAFFYLPHDKIVRERGEMLDKLAKFYGVSIDQIVHPDNEVPTEVVVEDKTLTEQVRLINGLEEKDKNVIFSMLETMITKQKFKDFFNKNVFVFKTQKTLAKCEGFYYISHGLQIRDIGSLRSGIRFYVLYHSFKYQFPLYCL